MNDQRLRNFARLAVATTVATYLLILVGALVRASGAGLGCPDWPKCYGQWIPPTEISQLPAGFDPTTFNPMLTWMEYANRLLGVGTGLLIVATLVSALRHHRRRPRLLWPTLGAALLVGFEGWLGGQVVRSGLQPWMVTAHLVFALVIVTLLLYASFHARAAAHGGEVETTDPRRRRLSYYTAALLVLTLVQVAIGTQVRAGIGAALQADPELPRTEWLAQVPMADTAHRATSQVVLFGVIALWLWMRRHLGDETRLLRNAQSVVALVLVQLGLGALLVYMDVPVAAQVLHLSAASLLIGGLTLLGLQARRESASA